MTKRSLVLLAVVALTIPGIAAADPPVYEPRVLPEVGKVLPPQPCAPESAFEPGHNYEGNCTRLKIVFGPIMMKPGQNDVLIQPVTFEKPLYPGYLTRFKPDLVTMDGTAPRVKDAHLHHGTWLNTGFVRDIGSQLPVNPTRNYGWGPWIASGEEKTVVIWPKGFGLKILPSDSWLFLHMIHNATPQAYPVWVTYDLDFVSADYAEQVVDGAPRIRGTKGIWLDVGDCNHWTESGCQKDSWNPVFNIHRGAGESEPGVCVFPRENCGLFNTLTNKSTQQGVDKGVVYDEWEIQQSGTLVMMGGHLHNGGLRDDVYLVRDGEAKLIHISDAYYFDHSWDPKTWKPSDDFDPSKSVVGAPPDSWDFVMTGATADSGWKINVKKGDKLRLEGVYDSAMATWYEQMGIVMSWLVPDVHLGFDPFDPNVTIGRGVNRAVVQPAVKDGWELPGAADGVCIPSALATDSMPATHTTCARGQATHARIASSGDHWSCEFNGCPEIARSAEQEVPTTEIHMGGFTFGNADFAAIPLLGIPTVKVGQKVVFYNEDTADYMWHTVTRCANPCSGTTSASYPIADGAWDHELDPNTGLTSDGKTAAQLALERGPDPMDFDSGQIGVGTGANNKLSWTFTPTAAGTFTFFCRIHPGMRGAIRVVDAA